MPFYEYRCPNGHLFEVFKSMSAPAPDACEVCGASPVEIVLSPVAIHYKGSGFYSTDYGKNKRKPKDGGSGADGGSDGGGEKGEKSEQKSDSSSSESSSSSSGETKKAAEA